VFTENEVEYLRGHRLGRLATVGGNSTPHIVPVSFRVNPETGTIDIGGRGLSRSKKWRDLQANPKAAFVADDFASLDPWTPRGVEVRGHAEFHLEGGQQRFGSDSWDSAWFSIVPHRIICWGLEASAFSEAGRSARSVAPR
jgi:pyridoxamine 5'-phosphate oxidase family protein